MRIRRKTTWIRSMKLTLEGARPTLAIHSNNKNKYSSKFLRQDFTKAWDSKP